MPNTLPGKSDEQKRDRELVKKIKPKLRKFIIDEQVARAAQTAKDKEEEIKRLQNLETFFKSVITQAKVLSHTAFFEKRLWMAHPPALEMRWLTTVNTSPDLDKEQRLDTWAFSRYLVQEYFKNYEPHKNDKRGYLNPMVEDNLSFFWQKFNADLRLLVSADKLRVAAGNEPVVLVKDPKKAN